ncbi:amino acid ABC transporter permease [Leucobacter luti]|uniref:Amino acid ABC transporter membrane protein (PAAT family) n=1 Tax=Leucobacter luti TaxID=340320 RepID=A0A4R6S0X2_9MICO|nr:amino acid ABC transporter permease [Leucobacter luti]MCW2289404.1 polar amino acid transport system permease protein [Leucobacter luti]QYM74824.1 amino acid ABC transporter permease [Leucobacter luti]TCK39963.1 amino acid ABC transporter membrane protein (PAAT family) [Leucobacter luti]TDP93179.1 amino acid ABC transporter membrane protein (PAAT family) [Leucobacter luti]
MSETTPGAAGRPAPQPEAEIDPQAIEAIRLRHPWRTVFAVVLAVIAVLFIYDAAFNRPVYNWGEVGKYLFDTRVISAIGYTLQLTIYAMIIAVVLGVTLAIMRLSPNPVVRAVSWVYLWVFRGTPVYVQLVFWGMVPVVYKTIDLGIPFTEAVVSLTTKDLLSYFALAVIGLALNEAAYMAEIVRAGLLSVDKGQDEAAVALGLGWWHTMTRVVLPQAMRVIIPPTGNELISMLKTTSLVTAVPFTLELYTRTRDIASVTYQPVPMLIVASFWYLVITSILMVGQYYVERHFGRGVAQRPDVMKPSIATGVIGVVGPNDPDYVEDDPSTRRSGGIL